MSVVGERAEGATTNVPVLIVGAGPTGLVLAIWLNRLGVAVRIIDKTDEPGTTPAPWRRIGTKVSAGSRVE
jgi:2-polyprenyl-6-methoxyphenol hydroxylase-like FAD-dependent oxidoreductase